MNLIPTIGLEMHCEMKSNTKVFSKAQNTYCNTMNNHVAPLDMALPGTLPVLNKECVRKAIKMALILNCEIPNELVFDRKNYYYPDLPKGFQITQFHNPIGVNGTIKFPFKEEVLTASIHDIHLEEDSAQLEHLVSTSLINYNRSGVPLLELVTEPCFHNTEEAIAFLEYIRRIYQYTDISDADATKGQIRCDVNVSMSEEGSDTLGTKVEVKNVNSFSNVAAVINYEIKRQTDLILAGKKDEIEQETRRWDEETQTTIRMRSKADAIDYKYFIEPNIPRIKIADELVEKIKQEIPVLPLERFQKYVQDYQFNLVETNILLKEKSISDYFDECIKIGMDHRIAYNWISGPIIAYLNKGNKIENLFLKPNDLKFIVDKINDKTISSKQAKEIFEKVLEEKKAPQELITSENSQISDETQLETIIDEIIASNPNQLEAYKNGKTNLFEFFVGQVMKNTRGKANPVLTRELLNKKINN